MFKKRIFSLLAVLLIAAMLAACTVGCTFVKKNDDRAANENYVTITNKGITLTVSYNELMDYFNSMGYYYINYYGYSVEETLDVCISTKIQTKYLLTEAMVYLTGDAVSEARKSVLVGGGAKVNPVDVLTVAEKYAAIYAVNSSIDSSLETAEEEAYQADLNRIMNDISAENVKEIVFAEETEAYFAKFFHDGEGCYVGNELDTDRVKIQVVYDNGEKSEAFIVPTGAYTTAFSSEASDDNSERTEDKNFVISFTENVTDKDGNVTEEAHTLTYDYKLVYPRDTREEAEEPTDYAEITIGDFDPISRYAKDSEIPDEIKAACRIRDIEQEYADAEKSGNKYKTEAYRVTVENIKNSYKTMEYFYKAQYESAVLSALQAEIYLAADNSAEADGVISDAKIAEEYRYLYTTGKNSYGADAEANKDAFVTAIKNGLDTVYYYPAITDISDYYYVYQILFSFTDEMESFLEEAGDDEASIKEFTDYFLTILTTEPSNADYDAEKYDPEDENAVEPFGDEVLVKDVIAELETKLAEIYNGTSENKASEATELFLEYLYKYNDDPGIFNNAYGYLMTADPEDSGWVDAFNELGEAIFTYDNAALGGAGKVGNAFDADGHLAYSCSNYGVHLMMISSTPFAGVNDEELALGGTDAEIIAYLKSRVNPSTGKSLYETLRDGLKTENRTLKYNAFVSKVPEDIFERDEKNNLTVNEAVKGVIDINVKKIKKEIYEVYLG